MIGLGPKSKYTDETVDRFKKTNLLYTTDPYLLYQDPTYLSFKLLFVFDQPTSGLLSRPPHQNTAMSYLEGIGDGYRMNYLNKFITVLQDINRKTPWFFQTIEGLDQAWKRGYQEQDFKAMLPKDRKITIGCEESIDLRMTALMDFYRKACFDWASRREVVPWNLRIFDVYLFVYEARKINKEGKPSPSGLLDLSKLIGLSDINKKQQQENYLLMGEPQGDPSAGGALSEVRNSVSSLINGQTPIVGIGSSDTENKIGKAAIDTIDAKITRVMFKFKQCEWLPDESSEIFTKVSNVIGDRATQKIAFSYRDVEEVNLYSIYSRDVRVQDQIIGMLDIAAHDAPYKDSTSGQGGWSLDSTLNKSGFGKLVAPFASLGAQQLERLISSYAGQLLMGNIYGFSTGQALSQAQNILSGDPTAVVAGTEGLVRQGLDIPSKKNYSKHIPGDIKYYDIDGVVVGAEALANKTKDVDSLGNTYNPPINQTKDVDSLGNTYE